MVGGVFQKGGEAFQVMGELFRWVKVVGGVFEQVVKLFRWLVGFFDG